MLVYRTVHLIITQLWSSIDTDFLVPQSCKKGGYKHTLPRMLLTVSVFQIMKNAILYCCKHFTVAFSNEFRDSTVPRVILQMPISGVRLQLTYVYNPTICGSAVYAWQQHKDTVPSFALCISTGVTEMNRVHWAERMPKNCRPRFTCQSREYSQPLKADSITYHRCCREVARQCR